MREAALVSHIAQEGAARAIAAAFFVAAFLAAFFDAKGPALGLALIGGAFLMARPGPSAALDKEAGRGP